MANPQLPKATFLQVVNHPVTYALVIVGSLLTYFVYAFTGATDKTLATCKEENVRLEAELTRVNKRNETLTDAILYYKGVVVETKKLTDSVVREKVGNEAKKIIE